MLGVSYFNMYVSCCRRTFTFQMTGRQKYAAAMTGTIQGPIYLHIALERLSLCDSGLWGWVAGILCSACWNKVDCWILFHNWIDFVHRSKSGSQLKSSTISKTVSTYDFWQTLSLHLIQILFATFYSFSTFWSGVDSSGRRKNEIYSVPNTLDLLCKLCEANFQEFQLKW